jgi:FK506-binding nuclear protein
MVKKGNKVLMRYIGKLPDGKVFDKNVKGKPVCDLPPWCELL